MCFFFLESIDVYSLSYHVCSHTTHTRLFHVFLTYLLVWIPFFHCCFCLTSYYLHCIITLFPIPNDFHLFDLLVFSFSISVCMCLCLCDFLFSVFLLNLCILSFFYFIFVFLSQTLSLLAQKKTKQDNRNKKSNGKYRV